MAIGETEDVRISVRNLWKVYGPKANSLLDENESWARGASKKDVQEKTGHVIAIKNVSFDVRIGEVFVVMGLSGSGKSTVVRNLLRLVEPTEGSIEIDGENIIQYDPRQLIALRRQKTGMIFQHYGLLPHRKVLDNVAFGLEIQGLKKEERQHRAKQVLERVGLDGWENAYPAELSGGMQQRVGIARSLVLDPPILLMDEPFSGLDPLIRREMQEELIKLQSEVQKTIVFITHDLDEALKLGDHIAIMRDGEIVQMGTGRDIVTQPSDSYVSDFVRDISPARVLSVTSIMQQPAATIKESDSLENAAATMRSENMVHAFVVDQNQSVRGYVTLPTLDKALQGGNETIAQILDSDYPSIPPDTLVENMVAIAAKYDCPVAVLDGQGQLLGEVHRTALLTSISTGRTPTANK